MATPDVQAKQAWHQALKLRKYLTKQIEKLRNENSSSGTNVSQFDAISESLEQFRLACVSTIFLDFEFAVSETSEDVLWQVHSTINAEFRRVLGKLKSNSHVERRKVETKYNHFLRIAQQFYKGYIQRLSARYDIHELKRVAHGIEAAQMDAADLISPVSEDLKAKVLTSCHSTLIRLGDLARYRAQAKHKKSGYETALAYYSLAHDLVPDSGFAFHQMGIVNQDEGNHLDVVYHFYRAWAVKEPHPNAKQNLEAKFRALQNTNANSRNKSAATPTPYDTFIIWFVRLQALFYKGEAVSSQHTELDKEVFHRLTMAAKDPKCAPILFKMALVNMSAYCISSSKYKDSKEESAFRFWQYILDFNIRFIHNLCGAIQSELRAALSQKEDAAAKSADSTDSKFPIVEALLPILRIYCIWLAAHRHDIFNATDALSKSLASMGQTLANVFTLLAAETYSREDLATCPYLLSEDLEMRGLKSFSEDQVPLACRPHYTDDGKLKPHLQSPSERLPLPREFAARMLDTLRCAYFLAEDPAVSLGTRIVEGWLVFEYQTTDSSQSKVAIPDSTPSMSISSSDKALEKEPKAAPVAPVAPTVDLATVQPTSEGQEKPAESDARRKPKKPENTAISGLDDADKTVLNMLSPFIDCPSPEPEHAEDETSYGMHTATANEIAQELLGKFPSEQQVENELPSGSLAAAGGLTPMYWANWNSRATPTGLGAPNPLLANGGLPGHRSPGRSSRGSVPLADAFDDPFPSQRSPRNVQPRSASGFGTPSAFTDDPHRDQLLQAFTTSQTSRQPSATGWSRNQNPTMAAQWGALGIDMGPISSGNSNFTNMSSLYQGTPTHGFHHGGIPSYGGPSASQMMQNAGSQAQPSSSTGRHFQMDKAAWNYDAAILQRALQGEE